MSFLGEALIYLRTRHHNVYNTEIIQLHIQERGGYVLHVFALFLGIFYMFKFITNKKFELQIGCPFINL